MLFLLSLLFACCCFLHYWRVVILTALQKTTVTVFSLCCVFFWMYRMISVFLFSWTGNGQEWTWCVVVEWISACVCCLVSACSSSWYVLYLFVRFSFELLSTCVATGWIFERSLCENSIILSITQHFRTNIQGSPRYFYRGKTTVIGTWDVSVIIRQSHYHPNRHQPNHAVLFPSKSLPK